MSRDIALVIYPGFQILDVSGPVAAFEIGGEIAGRPYGIAVVAAVPGPVAGSAGIELVARPLPRRIPDTVIVAGGTGVERAAGDRRLQQWVRRAAAGARRVASVCTGAFLLAEAGLLDGRRATTHWNWSAAFARRYPAVTLEPDRIFVRDGHVWTAAGVTAGIDLALAMVAADHGEAVARRTAQRLVVHHRRPGGQSQFSALVDLGGESGRFAGLLDWTRRNLGEPLGVERLAAQAAMSPRHFARAFREETGSTPAKAIERLRLETARERVEGTSMPIDAVARATGFGDPERMRRAFVRAFGQPPQGLRRVARSGAPAGGAPSAA